MFGQQGTTPSINDDGQNTLIYGQALVAALGPRFNPAAYPLTLWNAQYERYVRYRDWYDGRILNQLMNEVDQNGDPVLAYPLKINPVRNFARKLASVSIGEVEDMFHPAISTQVDAIPPLDGSGMSEITENEKKYARVAKNALDEVWHQSGANSQQYEGALTSWYMGGSVFKAVWQPWRTGGYRLPLFVERIQPEHFLPVWNPKDPFELYEVFEIYRLPGVTANALYGLDTTAVYVTYVEHWTRQHYSIHIDGKPLTSSFSGTMQSYEKQTNPWGVVPYMYLPSQRDGSSFYGSSFIEDIEGLALEYNSRFADSGDAVQETVHRRRFIRNVYQEIQTVTFEDGSKAINLGQEPPTSKHPPDSFVEQSAQPSAEIMQFHQDVWRQLLREGGMQNIAFGEDEGSQRSALTLAFRMWPTTGKARAFRYLWNDGKTRFDGILLTIMAISATNTMMPLQIPRNWRDKLRIYQNFAPMIPRDREAEVNEAVLLKQSQLQSTPYAIQRLGTVHDVMAEAEAIREEAVFMAQLAAASKPAAGGDGAETKIPTPRIDTSEVNL